MNTDEKIYAYFLGWLKDSEAEFVALPMFDTNGHHLFRIWFVIVPGMPNTPHEGAFYMMSWHFTENFPNEPPMMFFRPTLYHANVDYEGGLHCHLLNPLQSWRTNLSVKTLLLEIQKVICYPDEQNMTITTAAYHYRHKRALYQTRISTQIQTHKFEHFPRPFNYYDFL